MKLTYLIRYIFMLAIIASLAAVPEVQAQFGFQMAVRGASSGGDLDTVSSTDEMQAQLEIRISEIKDMVDLADKQVSKLNLAAKVVARKVFDERQKRLLAPRGNPQTQTNDDESFSDEDAESQTDGPQKPLVELLSPIAMSVALEHKTWKNAVKSILTADQQTSLQEYGDTLNKKLREVAVEYRTWELAKRLRLHDDQIEAVAQIVDRIEGERLGKEVGKSRGLRVFGAGATAPRKVTANDFQDVLTEAQQELFKLQHDGYTRQAGALQVVPNAGANPLSKQGVQLDSKAKRPTVESVTSGSRLEKMGVKVGDIIDKINGKSVDTLVQINVALAAKGKLVLSVLRDGKPVELKSNE